MNTFSVAAVPAIHGKSRRARLLYRGLDAVNFDHDAREDVQQVFMEQLELVATGLGLKPAFVAGQSSYSKKFLEELEAYAGAHGLLACRVERLSVQEELLRLRDPGFSRSALQSIVSSIRCPLRREQGALCLYRQPETADHIHACLDGSAFWGEALGYPTCCTRSYLQLESRLMKAIVDGMVLTHGAKTNDEFAQLFLREAELGPHANAEIRVVTREIQMRQARSIRVLPFVHFIACEDCLSDPASPAARINKEMSDLASDLSTDFARQFTTYACEYYADFLLAS